MFYTPTTVLEANTPKNIEKHAKFVKIVSGACGQIYCAVVSLIVYEFLLKKKLSIF